MSPYTRAHGTIKYLKKKTGQFVHDKCYYKRDKFAENDYSNSPVHLVPSLVPAKIQSFIFANQMGAGKKKVITTIIVFGLNGNRITPGIHPSIIISPIRRDAIKYAILHTWHVYYYYYYYTRRKRIQQ